jgi:uncharacterized membrane protein
MNLEKYVKTLQYNFLNFQLIFTIAIKKKFGFSIKNIIFKLVLT